MSWAGEAVAAIRKMVLIEDRMNGLTEQVRRLAESYNAWTGAFCGLRLNLN